MRDVTTIKFTKLDENATIPTGRSEDLGVDFYNIDRNTIITIRPNEVVKCHTGIAMAMDEEYGMILKERSSLGSQGIALRAGVIDSGYRGEVIVCLHNLTDKKVQIDTRKAIAQGVLIPNPIKVVEEYTIDELMEIDSVRGKGGFGSTDKK